MEALRLTVAVRIQQFGISSVPDSCDENQPGDNNEPTDRNPRICKARSPDPEGGLRKVRGELGYVARDEHRQLLDQLSRKTP